MEIVNRFVNGIIIKETRILKRNNMKGEIRTIRLTGWKVQFIKIGGKKVLEISIEPFKPIITQLEELTITKENLELLVAAIELGISKLNNKKGGAIVKLD